MTLEYSTGGKKSMNKIKVILRNPNNKNSKIDYTIESYDTELSRDWISALKNDILLPNLMIDKTFCFLGFPHSSRTITYLCNELNEHIKYINEFNFTNIWQNAGLAPYVIEEWFSESAVRFDNSYPIAPPPGGGKFYDDEIHLGLKIKHNIMNLLHNHFEKLQGTVWNPSRYYQLASLRVKYAIRNLNLICHELESLILSQRKFVQAPDWVRPSQITSFINVPRHDLTENHRSSFINGYDRRFGEVYMHWSQIGKTLMEVYNDEGAPDLTVGKDPTDITVGTGATCEAINSLKYYSGEFDIEWARDITYKNSSWHREHVDGFYAWLERNGIDYTNPNLGLGYLPIAQVDLNGSFGTTDIQSIWKILNEHLDIYQISVDDTTATYDYTWNDHDYHERQMNLLK
jgi:hypothetical protein